MANSTVKVAVLEGDFARLSTAVFPLSLALQLQQSALKLPEAMWNAKSTNKMLISNTGFSVSSFWPCRSDSVLPSILKP